MNSGSKSEAERLLEIAEQQLQKRDLKGSRQLALIAQENEPLLEGSDQILAIIDVLEAAEKPLTTTASTTTNNRNNLDFYAILQVDHRDSQDLNLIKRQYRRLALLLHPDKNLFSFSHHTFDLVSHAWALLSDPAQKEIYDAGLGCAPGSFWTACPYCFHMYEYPGVYEGCCLRCQKCSRPFHGAAVNSMPEMVPDQEAYYCSWGSFPMGFVFESLENGGGSNQKPAAAVAVVPNRVAVPDGGSVKKKRGRPRKVAV